MDSVPSTPVRVAVVKAINGDLQFRLAAVCVAQDLVLAPNIINLLAVEGIVKTLPLVMLIDGQVTGKNANKLTG